MEMERYIACQKLFAFVGCLKIKNACYEQGA